MLRNAWGRMDGFYEQPSRGAPQTGRPSDGSDHGLVPFDADGLGAGPKSSNLVKVWQPAFNYTAKWRTWVR